MKHIRAQLAEIRDALFPRRMCTKKRRHATQALAAHVMRDRQPQSPEKLHVFRCPECDGWHLTRMEQPE